jgi:bacteriocin biosynthesis cyclodehydratase domain-containing protein
MRPLLRPGTHVLSRGDGQLQLGLDPRDALVLPDTPAVRTALSRLDGSDHDSDPDTGTLDLLSDLALVVDERALLPLLAQAGSPLPRHGTAALARRAGPALPEVVRARTACRVEVAGYGHPVGASLRTRMSDLLTGSGLRLRSRSPRARRTTVGVLVGVGEPDRELVDPWTRAGTPYLLVRMTEGAARVGPFVVPGRTACLRCIDAHHTDADPAWPLLVRQYAAASTRDRRDGAPEPLDPLLAELAVAWAARDVASYVDGRRPSTWSSTLTLDPDLAALETQSWHRHPECGCLWS